MLVSATPAVERIARVLAGIKLSSNADGGESHAAVTVDMEWQDEIDTALAVLKTLREPDEDMAKVGDVATWRRMIASAIGEPVDISASSPSAQPSGGAQSADRTVGAAFAPGSIAAEQIRAGGSNPVRDAGPDDIRDEDGDDWDAVDEASDESFPASDPPSHP